MFDGFTPQLPAPDPPMGIFNRHNMIPRSDYEEETQSTSTIKSTFIEKVRRQICYNQIIYDDERLELNETAGLGLVPDNSDVIVKVEPFYGDSIFFIVDDDGKQQCMALQVKYTYAHIHTQLDVCFFGHIYLFNVTFTEAVVGLERTNFTVFEDVGAVELCARVFEPDTNCPIEFPFDVILSTADRTAGI